MIAGRTPSNILYALTLPPIYLSRDISGDLVSDSLALDHGNPGYRLLILFKILAEPSVVLDEEFFAEVLDI
jgi:hypothetical protein